MKIITMYDLLGMIKNEKELPKRIRFKGEFYELKDNKTYHNISRGGCLGQNWSLDGCLNETVDIIENIETLDGLNFTEEETKVFKEASNIFSKLPSEEDRQTFIKLLLGDNANKYLKNKDEK